MSMVLIREFQRALMPMPGLAHPPDTPPESINEYPAVVMYPKTGSYTFGSANGGRGAPMLQQNGNIIIDLHVIKMDAEEAMLRVIEFEDQIPLYLAAAFSEHRFHGALLQFPRIQYDMRSLGFGDDATVGWKYTVEVGRGLAIPVIGEEE